MERRETALNSQKDAQGREFDKARKEKEDIIDALHTKHETAQAKKRLLTGNFNANEKDELLEKVKEEQEFKEIYPKHQEVKQKRSDMNQVINLQIKQIEELNMELSEVDDEIRERKKIGKWKRRFLALLCVKIDDDDD